MSERKHWYPFNAEQTLNITSEIGPICTMFVVNFVLGIEAGIIALIATKPESSPSIWMYDGISEAKPHSTKPWNWRPHCAQLMGCCCGTVA